MDVNHKNLGIIAENLAHNFLLKKNFKILERNWRHHRYEIDLIAKKDNIISIVEVKSRSTEIFGDPMEAVTIKKRKRLVSSANAYIQLHKLHNEIRFDIISIVFYKNNYKLKLIEDAFMAHEV